MNSLMTDEWEEEYIVEDDMIPNPREDDNLGVMAAFHNAYNLGDEAPFSTTEFNGWEEMEEHIQSKLHPVAIKPLYLYDHSGVTMSTEPFSCNFDSGQVGFIYATNKDLDRMGIKMKAGETWSEFKERIELQLVAEVSWYDRYLQQ